MRGTYYIYSEGELVAQSDNVITEAGREVITEFLAEGTGGLGDYMAFGIGETPAEDTDLRLDFEYHRVEVDLKQPQLHDLKVLIRGTIPDEKALEVHEIGMFIDDDIIDEESPNTVITSFDSRDEARWLLDDGSDPMPDEGFDFEGGRTGERSFGLEVPGNGTYSLIREGFFGEFGDMRDDDLFALAYNSLSGGGTIEVRFRYDEGNYRSYQFSMGSGFQVERWPKSAFGETGDADFDNLKSLEIVVAAGGGGAHVLFDGLRYDLVTPNERPILLSRTVLPEPIFKRNTAELQIEYVVNLGFSS